MSVARLPEGCVLLSPESAAVAVRALRYALATADRAAVRDGGARPGWAGPVGELLEVMSGVGHPDVRGSVDEGGSGDAVHLIGTSEVAEMLGITNRQAQRRCAAMRSARRGPGSAWLVDAAELEGLVA